MSYMTTLANGHAPYAPSAASRWTVCSASVRATAGVVEPDTPYNVDGREAHTTLAYALQNGYRSAAEAYTMQVLMTGQEWLHRADNQKDRIRSIDVALDHVWDILDSYEDAELSVERRVLFPSKVTNDAWGTLDISIWVPSLALLFVLDYKHGVGVEVENEGNKQLGMYGTARANEIEQTTGVSPACIVTTVIQPRSFSAEGPIRTQILTYLYLITEFVALIDNAIVRSQAHDAPFVPGKAQCRFCPIRGNCTAREAAAISVVFENVKTIEEAAQVRLPDPATLDVARIGYVLQSEDILVDWLKDVRRIATAHALAGVHIPDHKIVEAQSRREWFGNPQIVAQELIKLTGQTLDNVMPRQLIGITEADKMVKDAFKAGKPKSQYKQAAEDAVKALAPLQLKASSGNLVLVHITDARPEANKAKQLSNVKLINQE